MALNAFLASCWAVGVRLLSGANSSRQANVQMMSPVSFSLPSFGESSPETPALFSFQEEWHMAEKASGQIAKGNLSPFFHPSSSPFELWWFCERYLLMPSGHPTAQMMWAGFYSTRTRSEPNPCNSYFTQQRN